MRGNSETRHENLTSRVHSHVYMFFFLHMFTHDTHGPIEFLQSLCGAANSSRVDSRGSCSTACQQVGVRVFMKKVFATFIYS